MKTEERIEEVRKHENEFIENLVLGLFVPYVSTEIMKKILKRVGVDVEESFIPQELSDKIDKVIPELLKEQQRGEDIHNLDDEKLQLFKMKFKAQHPNYSFQEISNSLEQSKIICNAIDEFLAMYNYIQMAANFYMDADKEQDPVVMFEKFKKLNKVLVNNAKKTIMNLDGANLYDITKEIFDGYLTPQFMELLSVEKLKAELEENKKNTTIEKVSYYKEANKEKQFIANEIKNLSNIEIASDELLKIEIEKEKFDKNFGNEFVAIDDENIISYAREQLAKIMLEISKIKQLISDALIYAGDDINDILREKHSYQSREYVKNLTVMSNKYTSALKSADMQNSEELLSLYKKAMAMYKVIDEMKANSFVVDMSRFSK